MPGPRFDVATTSALCAYHLAVLKRKHPSFWADLQAHPQLSDVKTYVQEYALVERADLPESITVDDDQYDRLGLDRVGTGYYARKRPDDQIRVIAVDHTFAVQESTLVRDDRLRALFDHVDRRTGWRGIEDEWIDLANGGDST